MSRSLGVSKQRTPVIPDQPRGPGRSIQSAQMSNPQIMQQQKMQQQYLQQQAQAQSQRKTEGPPSQVTVPQAIAVIIARLNSIERKVNSVNTNSSESLSNNDDPESVNELDLAMNQIFERLQALESSLKLEELTNKLNRLESDLRDSKDAVFKLQTYMISNTEQMNKLQNQCSDLSKKTANCCLKEIEDC